MTGPGQTSVPPLQESSTISEFISGAFRAWRTTGIQFLILRNYRDLPHSTSNDIDVLVRPSDLNRAEELLCKAAKECGFSLHNRARFATLALFFCSQDSTAQVHFDLFTELAWRSFDFLDCRDFFAKRAGNGLFDVPHSAHEAATNLMAFLLFAGRVKEKYRQSIQEGFTAHPEIAAELLARSYGSANARFLVHAGIHGLWAEIETKAAALRRALALRQISRQPMRTGLRFLYDCVRYVQRLLHPPGITVVLCGPDGCGKSTAAVAVLEGLSPTFPAEKSAHFHWKPPLFSGRRRAARSPASSPQARPPRRQPLSLLFFAFHWLEFLVGYYLLVLPKTFRGGMVVIERYYYDFFIDQRRYRLSIPESLVRLGYALLPRPDLALLLDAPAEILQGRKQEVPLAETVRQRNEFLRLASELPGFEIVDASQSPGRAALALVQATLRTCVRRCGDRKSAR